MTSEEIRAAIERLGALDFDDLFSSSIDDVVGAFVGGEVARYSDANDLCDMLIDLLRQADPDTHIKLPVDADGVPICIGDNLDFTEAESNLVVLGVGLSNPFEDGYGVYVLNGYGSYTWYNAEYLHHHHKPTIRDLLYKCCSEYHDTMIMGMSDVPCHVPSLSEVVEKYVDMIREAVDDE